MAAHPRVILIATADHPEAASMLQRAASEVERGAVGDPLPHFLRRQLAFLNASEYSSGRCSLGARWHIERAPTFEAFSRKELASLGAPLLALGGARGWGGEATGEEGEV